MGPLAMGEADITGPGPGPESCAHGSTSHLEGLGLFPLETGTG